MTKETFRIHIRGEMGQTISRDLALGAYRIGNDNTNDIVLPWNGVEQQHAILVVRKGGVQVRAIATVYDSNGIMVNQINLLHGQFCRIAKHKLCVEQISTASIPDDIDLDPDDVDINPDDEPKPILAERPQMSTSLYPAPIPPSQTNPVLSTPSIVAIPRGGFNLTMVLALCMSVAMYYGYGIATAWVDALGNAATGSVSIDVASLHTAIRVVCTAGVLAIIVVWAQALRWRTALADFPIEVYELALDGAGVGEALRCAEESAERERSAFRGRAADVTNMLVLLGMLLTATWLASKAALFQQASVALTSGGTSDMTTIVAGLLELGPKAFVSTASAVASALLLTLYGMLQDFVIGRYAPTRQELLLAWRVGATKFESHEVMAQRARTDELVERAVSASQVREMQLAFTTAMASMTTLLAGTGQAFRAFQDTAELIKAANKRLSSVTNSLNGAQINVDLVVTSLKDLTKQVESHNEKIFQGTKEFSANLLQDVSQTIPKVVAVAVEESVKQIQPQLTSLIAKAHEGIEASARALQTAYTQTFAQNLAQAQKDLNEVSQMTLTLESNMERLSGEMKKATTSMNSMTGTTTDLSGSINRVSEAFASAAGNGVEAAKATEAAREALKHAAVAAENSAQNLSKFSQIASNELHSIRRDAELLGQIKEVTRGGA